MFAVNVKLVHIKVLLVLLNGNASNLIAFKLRRVVTGTVDKWCVERVGTSAARTLVVQQSEVAYLEISPLSARLGRNETSPPRHAVENC